MECIYKRKGVEGIEKGSLRKNGGAFVLLSSQGKPLDKMLQKNTGTFEGPIHLASTDLKAQIEDKVERKKEKEIEIKHPVHSKRKVYVPPSPAGSLVFAPRAYVEPALLKYFKDYQVEGVKFVFERLLTSKGVILADEMGLGKTFQAVMIVYLFCRAGNNALIVCPCSLVGNWEREIKKWVPSLKTYNGVSRNPNEYTGREDILLMNYERFSTLRTNCKFNLIVCDEAHRLRANTSLALKALKTHASKRLLLTGTPFQNSVEEYKTLLSLVDTRATTVKRLTDLAEIATKAVLRRKVERTSLKLPKKIELIWIIKNQEYEEYVKYFDGIKAGIQEIQRLRAHSSTLLSKWKVLKSLAQEILSQKESLVMISRSIDVITQTETILKSMAQKREIPLSPKDILVFHGKMHINQREHSLNQFQSPGQKVIILSAKCGAEGLTLVKATQMIIIDSDWNPANDQQGMARIWRLGQTRPVTIHRLFMMGTIEEYILLIQMKKIEIQRRLDGEVPQAEIEEQLSQCDEELSLFSPQNTSIVHSWLNCPCTENNPFSSATGYSHLYTPLALILQQITNE
ncbi:DNA repair and recombination protein RAD54 and RAD54-like protein [Nematocida sp. AWRm80]|nr:DNA repair and recombination protein RAD54 and RAD54-like protein [Nematocida sp. AWRm80]